MTSSIPTDQQILGALECSGFLFEQEVATTLESSGFHVETSWAYLDPDMEKSREIDLRAVKNVLNDEQLGLQVFVELLVECKNSDSPLVFLERPKNKRELEAPQPREYVFPRKTYQHSLGANSYREVPAFIHLDLAGSHYYFRDDRKATQFSKIVRKGSEWVANHEGIYDSLFLPLAKALEARRKTVPTPSQQDKWRTVWLFFPVVVLRDNLMTLDASRSGRELKPRGRVTFVRNLDSDALKGDYLVDFVTYQYLSSYIANDIIRFADSVASLGRDKPSLLRGDDA